MSYEGLPGLVETKEALGETTLVVDPARVVEASLYLRDELGFNLLLDITATDYLGWGEMPVAGYYGTADGRDLNDPAAQGYAAHTRAEADPLHAELPPAARSPTTPRGCGSRCVSTTARRLRPSSRSGRPPTGTSGRPGT